MKIFLDTANVAEIREGIALGVVDGVTTNPSLAAKEKRPFRPLVEEICSIVPGDVSLEVVATNFEGMVKEGEELAQVAPNVVVKVPMTADGQGREVSVGQGHPPEPDALLLGAPGAALRTRPGRPTSVRSWAGSTTSVLWEWTDPRHLRDLPQLRLQDPGAGCTPSATRCTSSTRPRLARTSARCRSPSCNPAQAPAHRHRPQALPGGLGEVRREDLASRARRVERGAD